MKNKKVGERPWNAIGGGGGEERDMQSKARQGREKE